MCFIIFFRHLETSEIYCPLGVSQCRTLSEVWFSLETLRGGVPFPRTSSTQWRCREKGKVDGFCRTALARVQWEGTNPRLKPNCVLEMQRRGRVIHLSIIAPTVHFVPGTTDLHLKVLGRLVPFKFSVSPWQAGARPEWAARRWQQGPQILSISKKASSDYCFKRKINTSLNWSNTSMKSLERGGLFLPEVCGRKKGPHFPFRFISWARERRLGFPKPSIECCEN